MHINRFGSGAAHGAALMILAGLVVGCGGNSGTNSGTTIPLTTNLRHYVTGDSWTYAFSGIYTPKGGQAENDAANDKLQVTSVNGTQVDMTYTVDETINGATTNETIVYSYTQDATTGALTLASYTVAGNPTVTVTSTTYSIPGTFTTATNETGNTTYSSGVTEQDTLAANSTPNVYVPTTLASFDTWQMDFTNTTSVGDNSTKTIDWAPALGWFVGETVTDTDAAGDVTKGTYTLTATTVPASAWGVNPSSKRQLHS